MDIGRGDKFNAESCACQSVSSYSIDCVRRFYCCAASVASLASIARSDYARPGVPASAARAVEEQQLALSASSHQVRVGAHSDANEHERNQSEHGTVEPDTVSGLTALDH